LIEKPLVHSHNNIDDNLLLGEEVKEDTKKEKLSINLLICSWNLAGIMPEEDLDISKLLGASNTPPYNSLTIYRDIIVIGLQEFVSLSIKNAISGPDEKRLKKWKTIIESNLNEVYPNTKYINFHSVVMMGLCIIVYGKKHILELVSNIKTARVKTGLHGMGKNKGAVILR